MVTLKQFKHSLDADADVNAKTEKGSNALNLSLQYNHTEIEILLRNKLGLIEDIFQAIGSDHDKLSKLLKGGISPSAKNTDHNTLLMAVSEKNDIDAFKIILAAGADVNEIGNQEYNSLMLAAKNGHTEIVQTLLEYDIDVNAKNLHGNTALILGARKRPPPNYASAHRCWGRH